MEYIQIGKIINTHGIKGDVKVLPLTDDIKRFDSLKKIFVGKDKIELEISKVWYNKQNPMLHFKGYDNINDVEKFKNSDIWIDEKDKIKLPKDSYFIHDIIGLEVYLNDDSYLGKIKEVLQPGANDVYVVENEDKQYLIPAIKDVIKEVNMQDKKIIIEPIKGLLE
ncbi:16S rRNA processing protein RimM [Gottschalkia acidurici 9a]|uniref:Ribosome maturation factor RimM n=1 Tax=Gottschalkia acidurici (strain ATCC 7906 / DSM 604 / BCRC 14475 / CIP 104303 / KCTC 5404 / NCIMB 10678 / 9a) TaxID=1128398 RepID=K0AZD3_GOTA9|nr:ribosome maturation factor RimM [Gottschalkia acidurici]AFS78629.1 16S rRNA processing protein RimM [Gottschalkia acidurici 9a]